MILSSSLCDDIVAKEHERKQQSHTYINIRPGKQPLVVRTEDSDTDPPAAASGRGNGVVAQASGSDPYDGSARVREGAGRGELLSNGGTSREVSGEGGTWVSGEAEGNGALSSPGGESGGFPSDESPPGVRRRPLVVHNYENFPFNPIATAKNSDATPDPEIGSGGASPTRSRAESNASSGSAPPLPERHYSESDVSGSRSAPNYPAPDCPAHSREEDHESRDSLSPLHRQNRGASRSHEVQREVSEQGQVYAVVNPAWKKNIKGRSPSLTRLTDPLMSDDKVTDETPPPLPNRPSSSAAAATKEGSATEHLDLDSDLVEQKRAELEVGSRFAQSVRYVDVELSGRSREEGSRGSGHRKVHDVTYDTVALPKSQPEGDAGEEQVRQGGGRKRNERWLKTQSAYVTTSHTLTTPSSPPPPPSHTLTTSSSPPPPPLPTRDSVKQTEEALPAVPPKLGLRLGDDDLAANRRWLHAMNVTIRRPSESEGDKSGKKLSREALLLRSGVTLRPGTRPPWPPSEVDGGREGESGSDEEDGLEPLTR